MARSVLVKVWFDDQSLPAVEKISKGKGKSGELVDVSPSSSGASLRSLRQANLLSFTW